MGVPVLPYDSILEYPYLCPIQYHHDLDPKVASKGTIDFRTSLYHTSRGTSSAIKNYYKSMTYSPSSRCLCVMYGQNTPWNTYIDHTLREVLGTPGKPWVMLYKSMTYVISAPCCLVKLILYQFNTRSGTLGSANSRWIISLNSSRSSASSIWCSSRNASNSSSVMGI